MIFIKELKNLTVEQAEQWLVKRYHKHEIGFVWCEDRVFMCTSWNKTTIDAIEIHNFLMINRLDTRTTIFTHNHPAADAGEWKQSLSYGDIGFITGKNWKSIRAVYHDTRALFTTERPKKGWQKSISEFTTFDTWQLCDMPSITHTDVEQSIKTLFQIKDFKITKEII